jgi:large subunit ribosomal protein L3
MGILGKKLGMTQFFAKDGERISITVVGTAGNVVVGKRTVEQDGYSALQLGFGQAKKRLVNKPRTGHYAKQKVETPVWVREIRLPKEEVDKFEVGQVVNAKDIFKDGIPVDVIGLTKGQGYQGVMKRHGMPGFKASHGVHEFFRHGGSIGCRLTPGRVHKGKRMSGRMGQARQTVQNLELVEILEDGCLAIRGSVPGANGDFVQVKMAATRTKYKKVGQAVEEVRSKNPLKASKKAAAGRA